MGSVREFRELLLGVSGRGWNFYREYQVGGGNFNGECQIVGGNFNGGSGRGRELLWGVSSS